jgi:hypothetical protein
MHSGQSSAALRTKRTLLGIFWLAFGMLASPVLAAEIEIECTPNLVFVHRERLSVRCDQSVDGIIFFVSPTENAPQAARALTVIQSALLTGRSLFIQFDPNDLSGDRIGCEVGNCRLIQGIGYPK